MPELTDAIRRFLQELSTDPIEEHVVEYIVREVGNGRKLADALKDPYVKNRINEQRLSHVLEQPDVIAAIEKSITTAFERKDFGFTK